MILVLLGTQNNDFSRLLNKIEECIESQIITDKVIVQAGHTKFKSDKMEILDFISREDFTSLLAQADLIITHGGVGSIINSIKLNKKVIAIPRLKKYKEHINDHQLQIIESFDKQGFIKGVFNLDSLPNVLKEINLFSPKKYISNNSNILNIIADFIERN